MIVLFDSSNICICATIWGNLPSVLSLYVKMFSANSIINSSYEHISYPGCVEHGQKRRLPMTLFL